MFSYVFVANTAFIGVIFVELEGTVSFSVFVCRKVEIGIGIFNFVIGRPKSNGVGC